MNIEAYSAAIRDIAQRKNQWAEAVRVQSLGGQEAVDRYEQFIIALYGHLPELGPVAHCVQVIKTRSFSVAWPGSRFTATLATPQLCPKIVFLPGDDPLVDVRQGLEIETARLKAQFTATASDEAMRVELDSK